MHRHHSPTTTAEENHHQHGMEVAQQLPVLMESAEVVAQQKANECQPRVEDNIHCQHQVK